MNLKIYGFWLVLLVSAVALMTGCSAGETESSSPDAPTSKVPATAPPSIPEGAVKVINKDVGGSGKYEFDPARLTFNVGQEVTFAVSSETEFHTFTVDELDLDVEMDPGETKIFTFTFSEAGTYELICIPHETLGMVGEIVVQ